jgi:hypothetical protein
LTVRNCEDVGAYVAEFYITGLTREFPCTTPYLSSTADIIQDPVFESAIVKIQNGAERTLTKILGFIISSCCRTTTTKLIVIMKWRRHMTSYEWSWVVTDGATEEWCDILQAIGI